MGIIVLKIFLYLLLGILALLFVVCILNVKITVGNKGGFFWRLSVGGIRINPMMFIGRKDGHKEDKKFKKSRKSKKSDKKSNKALAEKSEQPQKKKSAAGTLTLISKIAQTAAEVLPKGFRIRLKYLHIVVGGEDAESVAVGYGKYYALLSGLFALFDGYKGLLYGFYAKRSRVVLKTDYLSTKTKAEFELAISFFVWQLLYSGIRIGAAAIIQMIKSSAEENDDELSADTAEGTEEIKNGKNKNSK